MKEEQTENSRGRVGKLAHASRGLVDDVKTWVELKIKLVEIQVEDRIESAVNKAMFGVVLGTVVVLAVLFALLTGAFALGDLFGSQTLGFLAVTGLLALVSLVIYWMRPRFVKIGEGEPAPGDVPQLPAAASPSQPGGVPVPPLARETPAPSGAAPSAVKPPSSHE